MSQTKRKPGEVAASAELGSHNPDKENEMNKAIDTTETFKNPVALSYADHLAAWGKCRKLGKQLSDALAEIGDPVFAYIQPWGNVSAVAFGTIESDTISPIEPIVETVDRLSARLAFALDDWAGVTNWHSVAHVYPASTGRGVWYENIKRETAGKSLAEKRRQLDALLNDAALLIRANPDLEISNIHIDRDGLTTFRLIPGVDLP